MTEPLRCHHCDKLLDPDKAVWLVLSCADGTFYATDAEADATGCNQGAFSFGPACGPKVLRASARDRKKGSVIGAMP